MIGDHPLRGVGLMVSEPTARPTAGLEGGVSLTCHTRTMSC